MKRILRKSAFVAVVLTLAFPTAAFAANAKHPGKPSGVMYVVRGTLDAYLAATNTTPGSVSITVKSSNHESAALKAAPQPLVFVIGPGSTSTTRVKLPKGGFTMGDNGIVFVRAVADATVAQLEAGTVTSVVDQGSHPVLFVIRGTLNAYSNPGTVSITVKGSNHERALLKSATQPLSFVTSSKTKVVLHDGVFTSGDEGIVKIRAPKNASVATLESDTAFQVIDQG